MSELSSVFRMLFHASKPMLLLPLTGLLLLNNFSTADDDNPILQTYCGDSANFTSGSPFETNVNRLLPILVANGPRSGFYNATSGNGSSQVYGLSQCRGDISFQDCQNCLNTSKAELSGRCPHRTRVVIGYEFCLLRYGEQPFFSQPDIVRVNPYPSDMWALNPKLFRQRLGTLINNLSSTAAYEPTKFAVGVIDSGQVQIYGLVQCTRDLSQKDCILCSQRLIEVLPSCCDQRRGARVLSPTCVIRYEVNPFVQRISVPRVAIEVSSPSPQPTNNTSLKDGNTRKSSKTVLKVVIPLPIVLVLLTLLLCICIMRKRAVKNSQYVPNGEEAITMESVLLDVDTIVAATDNFAEENKLGEGGFGSVYKGRLLNGQEIAVKRLSRSSNQGFRELRNEVVLVAQLQHRNLVRLLGCCLEGSEKLLVYEYVPNSSLDKFLFDPMKRIYLDSTTRFKIIEGIARGLLYLHEDSRLKIIHRDLKASNILLDEVMNAKISDFGMAKLFLPDGTHDITSQIAGTYGYMAPEYVMRGLYSIKSDVFSFGVLMLEILVGRKNTEYYDSELNLLTFIYKLWNEGTVLQLMDASLGVEFPHSEVLRCIQIGLLCVQKNAVDRPTMSSVVLMLNSFSTTLPVPLPPAFYIGGSRMDLDVLENDSNLSDRPSTILQPVSTND